MNDVLWNGSEFLAVGDGGVALSSADGVSWRQADTGTTETLYGVAWNGSQFTAVGTGGVRVESQDGLAWKSVDGGTSNDLYSVRWSGGRLLALGRAGTILRDSCGAQRGAAVPLGGRASRPRKPRTVAR